MGNTSSMVVFVMGFSLMAIIFTLSIYAVDPCSEQLMGNYIMSSALGSNLQGSGAYTCSNGNTNIGSLSFNDSTVRNQISNERASIGGSSTIVNAVLSIFPDWMFYGFNWITNAGAFILNMVGAPYTVANALFPAFLHSFASAIGGMFSLLFLWFLINWITGKDN